MQLITAGWVLVLQSDPTSTCCFLASRTPIIFGLFFPCGIPIFSLLGFLICFMVVAGSHAFGFFPLLLARWVWIPCKGIPRLEHLIPPWVFF